MRTFNISVVETRSVVVQVDAEDLGSAMDKVKEAYSVGSVEITDTDCKNVEVYQAPDYEVPQFNLNIQ